MNTNTAEYEGLCPVALSEGVDFQGTEEFAADFEGKHYLFGSADGMELFNKDPKAILDLIKR